MEKIKKVCLLCFLFVMALALFPVVSSMMVDGRKSTVSALVSQSSLSLRSDRLRSVTVTNPLTGDREVMSEKEYLCGIVASQMPVDYDDEAIKAQAVASYTLMRYRRIYGTPAEAQSFVSKSELKKKWGTDYGRNYSRMKKLVNSVYGEYIAYKGAPILAAYHDFSCGVTEYGGNVWNGDYPYLVAVESRDDLCAEDYRSTVRLTADEFSSVCSKKLGIVTKGKPSGWVEGCVRSNSGYVMSYTVSGCTVNGQRLRNEFGLRSACFTLKYEDNVFVFDVRGSGHGVGMSKFGANLMALNGKTYREILAHYYKGTRVIPFSK